MNLPKLNLSQIKTQSTSKLEPAFIDYNDPQTKEMIILFQYKLIQLYGPQLGIYVVPQLQDINTWHCIIFLRHGFYKDSKFKFIVKFPQGFPIEKPIIKFLNKVYHPLTDPQTGQVDLDTLIPSWDYTGNEMMYSIFKNLNSMFIDKSKLSCEMSFNPSIGLLYRTQPAKFMQKVIESIQDSQLSFTKNNLSSPLIINYSHWEQKMKIKQQLKAIMNEEQDLVDRKQKLMEYILNL